MTGTVVKSGVKQFGLKGCALVLAMQVMEMGGGGRCGGEGREGRGQVRGREGADVWGWEGRGQAEGEMRMRLRCGHR